MVFVYLQRRSQKPMAKKGSISKRMQLLTAKVKCNLFLILVINLSFNREWLRLGEDVYKI